MPRLHPPKGTDAHVGAGLPDKIFIHFVDHEVLRRGGIDPWEAMEGIVALIRVTAVVSPEPALFPISARDEHPAMEMLLRTLDPLFDSDVLHVTGAGSSPALYLARRQRQFQSDRQYFSGLFSPRDDDLATRMGSVWFEKRSDTSGDIRDAWQEHILAERYGMLGLLRIGGHTITDAMLERLLKVPQAIGGRPLIADVVVRELQRQGLVSSDMVVLARATTAGFLTSNWLRSYGRDLGGAVLRDFGGLLPDARGVLDHEMPSISARRAILALRRLGLYPLICRVGLSELALGLARSDVRVDVARDLFRRAAGTDEIWNPTEAHLLKTFRKAASRTSDAVRYRRRSPKLERMAADIERRLLVYAEALERHRSREAERRPVMGARVRFKVRGDVNIGNQTTIVGGNLVVPSASVAQAVVAALDDEGQSASLTRWIQNAEPISREFADNITKEVAEELREIEPSPSKMQRLRDLAGDLSVRAGGSLLATAILDGIKAAGHL
jgi:hypothetical protein